MKRLGAFGVAAVVGCGLAAAGTRTYEVEIVSTWSTTTHPGAFPANAHFTPFAGAVHGDSASLWEVGTVASPGLKRLAETGSRFDFVAEAQDVVNGGGALAVVSRSLWVCPAEISHPSCGDTPFTIEVNEDHHRVTLASMIGPSPDWFVGVSGLSLRDGGEWAEEIVVDLFPYDAGTRSNDASFALFGPLNDPAEPVSLITDESPQVIGGASLGTMTFRLQAAPCPADFDGDGVVGSVDLAVLLAGWGAGGETDLDGDGVTGASDLAVLLAGWGSCA